jgi:hypothetical protein
MTVILQRAKRARSRNTLSKNALRAAAILILFAGQSHLSHAQRDPTPASVQETAEQKIGRLTAAVVHAQSQMDAYQQQLLELRQQLNALQQQMALEKAIAPAAPTTAATPATATASTASVAPAPTLESLDERQTIVESQLATLEASKVETQSKYPLKVSGLLLFNGFVNTRQVDISAAPAYGLSGPGSTGLSIRQSVLGLDARGPHLMGATSHADIRVDFFANGVQSNYAASGVLRLRTAHAALDWPNTQAFFALDRTILQPGEPTSLVAIAQPELAWAGNLWNWNPQIGASHQFALSDSLRFKAQAALIDSSDPQLPGATESTSPVTQTERSRWPGTEARLSFLFGDGAIRPEIGAGGYYSPHRTADGHRFDAWAGTLDLALPLGRHFDIIANAYRGQALAGLGAGGYVNYYDRYIGVGEVAEALDDVGGFAQFKAKATQRLEFNAGYGIDNPFASEVHEANANITNSYYQGLARNRSVYSNVIYSPNAYLLFSLEYRRFWSNYAVGSTISSDVIGIGAGYKF